MRRMGLVAAALATVFVLGAGPAWAKPPGNNGTVKVDDLNLPDDAPNNEPHVGCVFEIDFYGYDRGNLDASATFDLVPPTAGGSMSFTDIAIGEDAAGGGTDLDASLQVDLTPLVIGMTPHPQQGFHVKLTVHAEGSQGADTKHKVFWVSGCDTGYPWYGWND